MLASLFCALLLAGIVQAVELPAGIKPCKDDAKLNECAVKAAKDAIKNLVKGDPKMKIPVMDPLYLERIAVYDGPGKSVSLNLTLNHLNIHGLSDAEFLKSEMDSAKKHVKWTFKTKELRFRSDYEMSGKFLLVPITGKGKAIINIEEPLFVFSFDYKLEDKKGKKFMVMSPGKLTYEPKSINLKLENLFNGDKALGDNVNKMLNENWQELNSQLGPGVADGIRQVLENGVLRPILKLIPYNKIITP